MYVSGQLSIWPAIHLASYPPGQLSIYLSIYLSLCVCHLSICKLENEAILPDFLSFWTWQHQKRSNSARLPPFLHLTTSKTKQVCETSSFSEVDNIKNEAILRDFLQKWKVECRADGLVPTRFAIFPLHLSKVLRLPRKSDARSYEVLHLSRKIISANLKIWCSKMQPLSGNQRPDLLTSLMNMSLVLRLPRKMHLCRSSSNVPRLPLFLEMLQNPHVLLMFDKVHNPLRLPRETTSERPTVVRTPGVFDALTSKCASRRTLFQHLNFQKWSGPGVLCTFWLRNVLRATTPCTFSTSQLLQALRSWCVLYILTSRCASRHNGVQFFIFQLASWLRTRRFSEPTFFDSPEPQIIGKAERFVTFLPFRAPGSSFFWDFLFFDLLSFSLLFADSSHLCFSSVYIVGSLTSKLPSIRENILAKVERLSFWNGHGHFSVKRKTRRYHIYFRMVAFRNGFGPYLCPFPKTSQHSFCV